MGVLSMFPLACQEMGVRLGCTTCKLRWVHSRNSFAMGSHRSVSTNPLRIGATIPDFNLDTTEGSFTLHQFLVNKRKPWTLFFSHPDDFTPVCTTELGISHKLVPEFARVGCKLLGLSCNDTESHLAWSKDVLAHQKSTCEQRLAFPMVADLDRTIVTTLGMLDPFEKNAEGIPLPARALIILYNTTVRLTILYPATTGRNFVEIMRVLTSLQLTENEGLATHGNWNYGERVIVGQKVNAEDAKEHFEDLEIADLPSGKQFLRSVTCIVARMPQN